MGLFDSPHGAGIVGRILHPALLDPFFPGISGGEFVFQDDDKRQYSVVINGEEQYSIWPEVREVPAGWRKTGFSGSKDACVAHVDEVWTDMRPASLRRAMEGGEAATVRSGHEQ
jgi:MbtH protein